MPARAPSHELPPSLGDPPQPCTVQGAQQPPAKDVIKHQGVWFMTYSALIQVGPGRGSSVDLIQHCRVQWGFVPAVHALLHAAHTSLLLPATLGEHAFCPPCALHPAGPEGGARPQGRRPGARPQRRRQDRQHAHHAAARLPPQAGGQCCVAGLLRCHVQFGLARFAYQAQRQLSPCPYPNEQLITWLQNDPSGAPMIVLDEVR